ncbi:predicted protein [Nematostella vectensis]|uniref:J domain-containing protein n=1 Tax=Nematostella vectensis TaxID=45351 RepID=A7SIV8_NEMVE|nr:predicted protein [Nematostella vectensis]|eukprot:XP_001628412.1 predicted protein [Nematostella vectensis]
MGKTLLECYQILGLNVDATQDEVKKTYKKLALECHPDKKPDDPDATSRFQQFGHAYHRIKSAHEKDYKDDGGNDDGFDWKMFFAAMFSDELYSRRGPCRCERCGREYMVDDDDDDSLSSSSETENCEDNSFTEEEMAQFRKFDSLKEQREFNKQLYCAPKAKSAKQLKAEQWRRQKEISNIAEEIEMKKKTDEKKLAKAEKQTTNSHIDDGVIRASGLDIGIKQTSDNNKPQHNQKNTSKKKKKRKDRHRKKQDQDPEPLKEKKILTQPTNPIPSLRQPKNIPLSTSVTSAKSSLDHCTSFQINMLPEHACSSSHPLTRPIPKPQRPPQPSKSGSGWARNSTQRQQSQYEMQQLQPSTEEEELRQLEIAIQMSKRQAEIEESSRLLTALEEELLRKQKLQQQQWNTTVSGQEMLGANTLDPISTSSRITSPDIPLQHESCEEMTSKELLEVMEHKTVLREENSAEAQGDWVQVPLNKTKSESCSVGFQNQAFLVLSSSDMENRDMSVENVSQEQHLSQSAPDLHKRKSFDIGAVRLNNSDSAIFHIKEPLNMCPYGRNCCLGKTCTFSHPPPIKKVSPLKTKPTILSSNAPRNVANKVIGTGSGPVQSQEETRVNDDETTPGHSRQHNSSEWDGIDVVACNSNSLDINKQTKNFQTGNTSKTPLSVRFADLTKSQASQCSGKPDSGETILASKNMDDCKTESCDTKFPDKKYTEPDVTNVSNNVSNILESDDWDTELDSDQQDDARNTVCQAGQKYQPEIWETMGISGKLLGPDTNHSSLGQAGNVTPKYKQPTDIPQHNQQASFLYPQLITGSGADVPGVACASQGYPFSGTRMPHQANWPTQQGTKAVPSSMPSLPSMPGPAFQVPQLAGMVIPGFTGLPELPFLGFLGMPPLQNTNFGTKNSLPPTLAAQSSNIQNITNAQNKQFDQTLKGLPSTTSISTSIATGIPSEFCDTKAQKEPMIDNVPPYTYSSLPMDGTSPVLSPLALQMYYQTLLQMQMEALKVNIPAVPSIPGILPSTAINLNATMMGARGVGDGTGQNPISNAKAEGASAQDVRRPTSGHYPMYAEGILPAILPRASWSSGTQGARKKERAL